MEIKTKYNIGDEVWAFLYGEPTAGKITKTGAVIEGYFEYKGKVCKFRRAAGWVHFPRTKEDLLKRLLRYGCKRTENREPCLLQRRGGEGEADNQAQDRLSHETV